MSEPKQPRPRWWRRLALGLLALLAAVALLVIGLEVAVRQPGVRQAVTQRLADIVAERTGLVLEIDDLRASLLRGRAEIDGLTLSSPGEVAILATEHIEVAWRLSSLWDSPFTLKVLTITEPEVDLGAPLPALPATSGQGESGFALAIEHFELVEGRIDGPVMASELEAWIQAWWLEDLTLAGWYGAQGIELDLESLFLWQRSDGERVEIAVEGELGGPQDGPWTLTRLSLRGDGMEADLTAAAGPTLSDPVVASFDAKIEPHLLVPVPPSRGPIAVRGDFDTAQKSGSLQIAALEVPVELASPWMSKEARDNPLLAGWNLDIDADLALGAGDSDLTGMAQLRLARQEETWATGEIEVLAATAAGGVGARLDGVLLPGQPGRRTIQALVEAPDWTQVEQLTLSQGEIGIVETDLAGLREAAASIWPQPLTEAMEKGMVGVLEATANAAGPINGLRLDLEAQWSHGESARFELLAAASTARVSLESVSGRIGERRLQGSAQFDLPMPIGRAEVRVEVDHLLSTVPEAALTLSLEGGVANIDARIETPNGVSSTFLAEVPLASLDDLPEIGEVLAALPLDRAAGPASLDWKIPEAEWAEWVSQFSEELPFSSLRLGSQGSLQFELSQPLSGRGQMILAPLDIRSEEMSVAAEGPIQVRLEQGQLILEATRLRTEGGVLEAEAWTQLATDWRPGNALESLLQSFRVEANGATPVAILQNIVDEIFTDGDIQMALSVAGTLEELTGELRVNGPDAHVYIGDPEGMHLANPTLEVVFEGDSVRLERARLEVDGREIMARGEIPTSTLLALRDLESRDPVELLEPLSLVWEVPPADWAASLSKLGVDEPPESLVIGGRGEIVLDPTRPLEAEGWIEVSSLSLSTKGHEVRNDGPLRVELAEGRLDLTALKLFADDQPFVLAGSLDLDRAWSSEQSALSLVESLAVQGEGSLAAVLLNPFLAGGSADGLLLVDLEVEGTLADPLGRLRVQGPDASVLFLSPYVAKIEAPELDLVLVDGRAQVRDGRVRLNGGDVELDGSLGLDGVDLFAAFDSLRFRLDHGVLVRVDGELNLAIEPEGPGRLTGEIIVDQGSLTRPISINRDFLTDLLSPIDLTGTETSPLEDIELDLALKTRRGVLVRNNVADLSVQWDEVRVRGNLLQPVIDGQFRVEPGGRAFLFGQTLRIDRGVMTFPGQAGAEAILDLETTSSLDDPGISRLAGDDALSLGGDDSSTDLESRTREAGWSAAAFVSEQVATRIADAIPSARFTFRPILIFGEADPGARLTIGREFSRYVTLAASIDLRNAERQTYLMDAHDFPRLPGLVVQVFTNDMEQEGFTLQHRLRFGGYRRTAPTGPNLRRLAIDEIPDVSKRALRRSVGLGKGDRASVDDLFLAEVEVIEFLRAKGYPDARVKVESRPVPERSQKVDLEISIEPGPFVRFEFSGEELPRALQRSITPLYRSDFYEPVALAEMETQTVRALRSLGFLFPLVQLSVEVGEGSEGRQERTVFISTMGGDQASLETIEWLGLSEEEAEQVDGVFGTGLQRIELATAEPWADRRLLSEVRGLGYPDPEILDRTISEDRRNLTVVVKPGSLRHLGSVSVRGVDMSEAARLVETAAMGEGEVARRDRIAAGALAIEADLRSRGFVNAQVRPRLEDGESGSFDLTYEVEPGSAYTVADTDISGLRSTSRRWATNVAEMESGAPLRETEVSAARSRLYETGLFTMVRSDSFQTEGGQTEVVFDVEERPRFSTAYGLRWDSDEGTQAVVDVVDQNFLGRSVTLGLRALYKQDDWNVRLGAGVPRLFGSRAVLELFASYEDLFEEVSNEFLTSLFDEQITEASLQVAYPFGRHISGRIYGRYRVRDTTVTDIEEDPIFPLPPEITVTRTKTPLLGTVWIYDSRNRELVLSRGIFASMDLSGTGEILDSDFEYVRTFAQFNLYRPVKRWAGRRFSWAQSLRLGLADSFDQELDRDDRFFAGGQYSVRGYPTNSLGPVEVLGDNVFPLGGKTLLVINQEVRFDVFGPLAGLVFLDFGNVWEDTAEFSSGLFKSIGLGLRADTPIGLLRLDWAYPLDRREGDPASQVYFGFGNTF